MTGKITDKVTKEAIYNVQVFSSDNAGNITDPPVGTTSNFDGDYSLAPQSGFVTFKHVAYQPVTIPIPMGGSTLNVQMQPGHELPGVEIVYDARPWYIKYRNQTIAGIVVATALLAWHFNKKPKK